MRATLVLSLIASMLVSVHPAFAQREDRVWVFGEGAGIDFNDIANPQTFVSSSDNWECSASICDTAGNLEFYVTSNDISGQLYNGQNDSILNDSILNGSGIKLLSTFARGAVIIPFFKGSRKYHLFHSGDLDFNVCALYRSVVDMEANAGRGEVIAKNILLSGNTNEGIAAVQHANGTDWWVIVHEQSPDPGMCTDKFLKYLVKHDLVTGPFEQHIGTPDCVNEYPGGGGKFSEDGTLFAYNAYVDADTVCDIFDFNRCTGELSNHRIIWNRPYGMAFSPSGRYLYIQKYPFPYGRLFQYDMLAADIDASGVLVAQNYSASYSNMGQLQLAPDGKIYMITSPENKPYLSVIHQPDAAGTACDFRVDDFYLGPVGLSSLDLPNMPNYNLAPIAPLPIAAAAGEDQIFCKDTVNGVLVGTSGRPALTYAWSPEESLDDPSAARPFATPLETTAYILTVTLEDSLCFILTPERSLDTVIVTVDTCAPPEVVIFFPDAFTPNDDTRNDHFELVGSYATLAELRIYNRWGQLIHNSNEPWDGKFDGAEQPIGTYAYHARVLLPDGNFKQLSGVLSLLR